MKQVGVNKISGDEIFLWKIDSINNSLSVPEINTDCFGALVIDSEKASVREFSKFWDKLLEVGLVNIDFFGKMSRDLCDDFDQYVVDNFPKETYQNVIQTVSHEGESLIECLWHFLFVSFRAESYAKKSNSQIIITIGEYADEKQLISYVQDQAQLYNLAKGYIPKELT